MTLYNFPWKRLENDLKYVEQRHVVSMLNEAPRLVGICVLGNVYHYWAKVEWSQLRPCRFTMGKAPRYPLDIRMVVYTAGLDGFEKQNINNHVTSIILHINYYLIN